MGSRVCAMRKLSALIFAAVLTASAAGASAATLVSENFDSGYGAFTVTGNTIDRLAARPTYQTCCGATGTDAALDNPFVAFGGGNAVNNGALSTTFATVLNKIYTLSFSAGAFGGGSDLLSYAIDGVGQTLTTVANNNANTTFKPYTATFVGTGNPTTLSFSDPGAGINVDTVLDNVTVSAVPEPATWGLMLVGFAFVGVSVRSRQRKMISLTA